MHRLKSARVTVLFADVVGFTPMAENLPPEEVAEVLEEFFTHSVEAIFAHGGTLDKFIGDCVMAFFGAPMPQADHAQRAVRTAIDIQRAIKRWNDQRSASGGTPLLSRIALNSGPVVVGDVGSNTRRLHGARNTVNVAARLDRRRPTGRDRHRRRHPRRARRSDGESAPSRWASSRSGAVQKVPSTACNGRVSGAPRAALHPRHRQPDKRAGGERTSAGVDCEPLDLPEPQSLDLLEVLRAKGAEAFRRLGRPVVVEETGLELAALSGFPGPLVKWMLQAVGAEGIARTALALGEPRVTARCALLWTDCGARCSARGSDRRALVPPRGSGASVGTRCSCPTASSAPTVSWGRRRRIGSATAATPGAICSPSSGESSSRE